MLVGHLPHMGKLAAAMVKSPAAAGRLGGLFHPVPRLLWCAIWRNLVFAGLEVCLGMPLHSIPILFLQLFFSYLAVAKEHAVAHNKFWLKASSRRQLLYALLPDQASGLALRREAADWVEVGRIASHNQWTSCMWPKRRQLKSLVASPGGPKQAAERGRAVVLVEAAWQSDVSNSAHRGNGSIGS